MNNFDHLHLIMRELDKIEGDLQSLRDHVDFKTKRSINHSIQEAQELRDCLWDVDKALEADAYGGGRNEA